MTQLSLNFDPDRPNYAENAPPGTFEHASGDCKVHGPNVVHFRLHKAGGPRYCVACALKLLELQGHGNSGR